MPKARNPNRDKAREMWASDTNITIREIASTLGETESTIRKWKSADKWERAPKNTPKKRSNKRSEKSTKKRGAPKGNQNAKGNRGGGAPIGSQNALVHGGYSKIYWDTLTDEERAMLEDMPRSEEDMLIDQIKLLSVRERRLMQIINYYRCATTEDGKPKTQFITSISTNKENKVFHSEEDKELYEEIAQKKIEEEKISYLFDKVLVSQTTESVHNVIQRLERELTSVQRAKNKAIDSLVNLRKIVEDRDDDWVYRMEFEDMDGIEREIYGTEGTDN